MKQLGMDDVKDEEFRDLYRSRDNVRVANSRELRLVRHASGMREAGNAYRILVGKYLKNWKLNGNPDESRL
jgi:hypothetical protein